MDESVCGYSLSIYIHTLIHTHNIYIYIYVYSILVWEIPWTVARQDPLSMEFSRQEYWSGLPFPSPGDLPNLRIKLISPALAGRCFTTEPPGKPHIYTYIYIYIYTHTHTHTYTCYSAIKKKKNEISPFVTSWVDLKSIMHGKISQTEKEKCCMISLIIGI